MGNSAGKCMAKEFYLSANTKMKTQGHNSWHKYFEKCLRLVHMYLQGTLCMSPYACMKQSSTLMHLCVKHIHLCMVHIHLFTEMSKHYVSTVCIMSKHKICLIHKCMLIEQKCLISKHKWSSFVHNVAISCIFLALIKCLM